MTRGCVLTAELGQTLCPNLARAVILLKQPLGDRELSRGVPTNRRAFGRRVQPPVASQPAASSAAMGPDDVLHAEVSKGASAMQATKASCG